MIGFTRLLVNNKYADTLVTSRGMWPPPIIIKLHKALGIHVIKKKQTAVKELFKTWMSVRWNYGAPTPFCTTLAWTLSVLSFTVW